MDSEATDLFSFTSTFFLLPMDIRPLLLFFHDYVYFFHTLTLKWTCIPGHFLSLYPIVMNGLRMPLLLAVHE